MASNKTNITLPQLPNIELHITGEWEKAINLTDNISNSIRKGYDKGSSVFSTLVLNKVRRAIISGRPPSGGGVYWPPLSESYMKRWSKKYPGHSIYNLTGTYLRSLGIHKYKSRTIIGLPYKHKPGNSRSSLTLIQVAIILEYGSRDGTIPGRPLWKPSLRSAGGTNKLKKEIIHGIRSQLYHDFGINPKQIR